MTDRNANRSGYKKTCIGWIPEEWDVKRFKEIVKRRSERYDPQDPEKPNYKCIELTHIDQDTGTINNTIWAKEQKSSKNKFLKNDVLFGKLRPYLRKFYFADFQGVCSSEIWVFIAKKCVHPKFLFYLIQTNRFIHFSNVTTGTKMPRADWSFVKERTFAIPKKDKQKKIVEIIDIWDRAIEQTQQLIEAKRRLKKGLMQQLLTGRMRFPEFGQPVEKKGELPEGWEEKRLGDLGKFSKGYGIKKSNLVNNGLPCIRYGDIYTTHDFVIRELKSFIDIETAKQSEQIFKGDILFAGSGEKHEEIGKCVAYVNNEKAYAGGDIIIFRGNKANSTYLGHLLNNSSVNKQKFSFGQGYSIVHIYSHMLKKISIFLPSFEEQEKIISLFSKLDKNIYYLENIHNILKNEKRGLMQKLLTGEVRV